MTNQVKKSRDSLTPILWGATGILLLSLLFARALYPEALWLTMVIAVPLIATLGGLIQRNQKALKSRTAAYGLNSLITVLLVIGILGVLDFLTARYPYKIDLTKNKIHTLSDQTVKLVKGLKKPVKATLWAKMQQKDQFRGLLDNYKSLNPKFEVEFVDPDREPTRAKQANIKKYGTLQLVVGTRENKIEEPTEEKLTNSLIKLLKDKSPLFCVTSGHGEKNFNSQDTEGYSSIKKSLSDQSYEVKVLDLLKEAKDLEGCDALGIIGPMKSFFENEIKIIHRYFDEGGRGIVAVDVNLKGGEYAPELLPFLQSWNIKANPSLVVDPLSRMLGVDASVAILATFSKSSPITRDFQGNCAFPFTRPLEIIPGAPPGLNIEWIAQTTPKSWAVADLHSLSQGEVHFNPGKDKTGPLDAGIAIEGKRKDSKAPRNTRLVVFGSSFFGTNNFSRYAGNADFFLNSVSWVMEDENLISIRTKEEGPGKVELSQKSGTFIFLLTVVVVPLLIAVAGLVIWMIRRRL